MSTGTPLKKAAKVSKRGPYKTGLQRQKEILEAARQLLIDEGYHSFSLRKVASNVGISVGNLQHYFPSRDDLVTAMLDSTIEVYIEEFERLKHLSCTPKQYLFEIIQHVTNDLTTKSTTVFFPELWSLSNHEPSVDAKMQNMYARYKVVYKDIAQQINPSLSDKQADTIALFASSTIEGHTMFIGYNKPYNKSCRDIVEMTYNSILRIIETGAVPD